MIRSLPNPGAGLAPGLGKPGSVESLIDQWVHLKAFSSFGELPPALRSVAELGFDAVPDLIAHLDDPRLTGYREQGWISYFPGYPWTVGNLSSRLLSGLAGRTASAEWREGEPTAEELKARASAWFESARRAGERAYLVERALPPGDWPDPHVLLVLAKKFPEELGPIYRRLLEERQEMQSWPVAESVAESLLPSDEKVGLLVEAAGHGDLLHRFASLGRLDALDHGLFLRLLVRTLEELPVTPQLPYGSGQEPSFVFLVQRSGDPAAWEALRRAALRADVGLRMEYLEEVGGPEEAKDAATDFLAGFLEDAEVRQVTEDPSLYDYRTAARDFKRLEVRDLAALRIAAILGLDVEPRPDWSPRNWEGLREEVLASLMRDRSSR